MGINNFSNDALAPAADTTVAAADLPAVGPVVLVAEELGTAEAAAVLAKS